LLGFVVANENEVGKARGQKDAQWLQQNAGMTVSLPDRKSIHETK
jgi:hypothetical protein